MNTLYIRLPSRAASATAQLELPCPYALVVGQTIAQQGISPLPGLAGQIAKAQQVVLLLAASDVTLLRVRVPPLSPAKLKLALPNLVEDLIIGDPAECAIVAGSPSDGMRSIAVTQRDWLEQLGKVLHGYGARLVSALPAQLCLPPTGEPDSLTAAVQEHGLGADLSLRLAEHEGIGLAIGIGQNDIPAREVIAALNAIVPEKQVTLYVPQESVASYRDEAGSARINVSVDNWSNWIDGVATATLDLMAHQRGMSGGRIDWRAWRWPLLLTGMILLLNIAALNFDWLQLKREAGALRAAMFQTYRTAYPNETVIIDPIAQMQQKIAAAKHGSGQAAADDFTAMMAIFGEAWTNTVTAGQANAPGIAAFEYRERRLRVKFKPGAGAPLQQIRAPLALHNLSLESVSSSPVVWEIRSIR
ncbi:MAG TPA: type II secretion system protein GspL [Gallionella sp.]